MVVGGGGAEATFSHNYRACTGGVNIYSKIMSEQTHTWFTRVLRCLLINSGHRLVIRPFPHENLARTVVEITAGAFALVTDPITLIRVAVLLGEVTCQF